MKVCLKEYEFNPSFIALYGEEKANADGYTIVEVPQGYEDCAFEDFENFEFSIEKYNARNNKQDNEKQIAELTEKLYLTDYIANKLAEANAEYIVTEDKTKLIELRTKYAKELADRETWRKEIDSLKEKLKKL